jgi:hypothetical protein
VGKPEGNRPLETSKRRCQDTIKMDLRWDGMDWIDLAQDRYQWRAFLNIVLNLVVYSENRTL